MERQPSHTSNCCPPPTNHCHLSPTTFSYRQPLPATSNNRGCPTHDQPLDGSAINLEPASITQQPQATAKSDRKSIKIAAQIRAVANHPRQDVRRDSSMNLGPEPLQTPYMNAQTRVTLTVPLACAPCWASSTLGQNAYFQGRPVTGTGKGHHKGHIQRTP